MSPEGLKEALQHALLRKTFRPFLIELTSGTKLTVERPEDLDLLERTLCLRTGQPPLRNWFDAHSVARVCDKPPQPPQPASDFLIEAAQIDLGEGSEDEPFLLE